MRAIALFFALIGVSAAATIYAMDGQQMEEALMEMMARSHPIPLGMSAAMGIGGVMGQHDDEEVLADEGAEVDPERDARGTEADETLARESNQGAQGNGHGHQPSGFEMMSMVFPAMMFTPEAQHPAPAHYDGNGQAASNGNGYYSPANGNGYSHPVNGNKNGNGNANGNRRGSGGAAAANAQSFSRGPNSYATSQAQAFSGNFGQGNH